MPAVTVVFVHGWSVTDLNTYGNLPGRLRDEARKNGIDITTKDIFLGQYISFHDEVRLNDISRAFKAAVADQLAGVSSFICITHSTGGPVIRDWQNRYGKDKKATSRMSHLIMLAPANYGSALAQLGKGTLSRLKSWWNKVEPGQGVLDWLCLGSDEAWNLNMDWIRTDASQISEAGFFPFVLTGQSIDREFYDTLNSYTGETGSDGVVRVAAANLEATYIKLQQPVPQKDNNGALFTGDLQLAESTVAPPTALRVISRRAHSGKEMGIMYSVGATDDKSMETVHAIIDCMLVKTHEDYEVVAAKFITETEEVQKEEKLEVAKGLLLTKRYFVHDRYTMVIFRLKDSEGFPVNDYDLILTAGDENDPNHLPEGFFVDRQQNKKNTNTVTYFLNYDILEGADEVKDPDSGKIVRESAPGITKLGLKIVPRPADGFVRYLKCAYMATKNLFDKALNPNSTTMIDIVLQRVVDKEVFMLEPVTSSKDFSAIKTSNEIAG